MTKYCFQSQGRGWKGGVLETGHHPAGGFTGQEECGRLREPGHHALWSA